MSKRVITSVTYDLKFDVRFTHPSVSVSFTDVDDDGHEEPRVSSFMDVAASALFPTGLLDAVNAALDAQAAAVAEPGTVAARIEAASKADRQYRAATVAKAKLDADNAAADAELAAKRAEIQALIDVAANAKTESAPDPGTP